MKGWCREMIVLTKKLTIQEIAGLNDFPNGFVKGVVDIEQGFVALDAEWHYLLANFLRDTKGSKEIDMWGFNLLFDVPDEEVLEFDSFINIHNNQLHGFLRGGMDIKNSEIEAKATEVIKKWIEL